VSDGGRAQILGAVRSALKARSASPRPSHLVPQRARLQAPELRALFVAQAEGAGAKVQSVADDAALAEALRALAAAHGGVPVVAPASPLANLPWGASAPALRPVESGDALAVSTAVAGLAETGSLALASGPENPVLSAFLPEHHAVVLPASALLGPSEDLWAFLREQAGAKGLVFPRTLHWITGPSRSGDIEMTMLFGAHGPLSLTIFIQDDR
jgi:L-lactate dehydrogenase complex protein LldG